MRSPFEYTKKTPPQSRESKTSKKKIEVTPTKLLDAEQHGDLPNIKQQEPKKKYQPNKDELFHRQTNLQSVANELRDEGIVEINNWRNEIFYADAMGNAEIENILREYTDLFTFLEDSLIDQSTIEKYRQCTKSSEKMDSLRAMSTTEMIISCITHPSNQASLRYIIKKLTFYQNYVNGTAVKYVDKDEWDNNTRQWVKIKTPEPIDTRSVSLESIKKALMREMFYAVMIGTPELASIKIATDNINKEQEKKSESKIKSIVALKGYDSGVFDNSNGLWDCVIEEYRMCFEKMKDRYKSQDQTEEFVEHESVLLFAQRLKDSFDYRGTIRYSGSPYTPTFEEAIVAGRLGYTIMKQMSAMRKKIQETDLHNIKRFIGKSGNNPYYKEKKRLDKDVEMVRALTEENQHKEEFGYEGVDNKAEVEEHTQYLKELDIWKQHNWFYKESERVIRKFTTKLSKMEESDLAEDEKALARLEIEELQKSKIESLEKDRDEHIAYFENRDGNGLLADLQNRQKIVDRRFEKRKSLAQKSLDLHFAFNHTHRDGVDKSDEMKLAKLLDWINDVPLGTIKRAHKMMKSGVSQDKILAYSITEIICGKESFQKEVYEMVTQLLVKIEQEEVNYSYKHYINNLMTVAEVFSQLNFPFSVKAISRLVEGMPQGTARESTLKDAIKNFGLENLPKFKKGGVSFEEMTSVYKVLSQHNINLEFDEILDKVSPRSISSETLEEGLKVFEFDFLVKLISEVDRYNLIKVIELTKALQKANLDIETDELIDIANLPGYYDPKDFVDALKLLSLEQIKKLMTINHGGICQNYVEISRKLLEKNIKIDFEGLYDLLLTTKQSGNRIVSLVDTLEHLSLDEIREIIKEGPYLSSFSGYKAELAKIGETNLSIQEICKAIAACKNTNITTEIKKYGTAEFMNIVRAGGRFYKMMLISLQIDSIGPTADYVQNKIKYLARLSSSGANPESIASTITAGFTLEQMLKYPQLISSLPIK